MTWRWVIFSNLAITLFCDSLGAATVSGLAQLSASKDHSGVVVWLDPVAGKPPDTPPQTAVMAHHHKTFVPHVLAVRTGSKVRFPNLDPFFHNAFSKYDGQIFDVGLHPPGSSREVTFRRPGVVRLFCNIHPTMSSVIVVLDTPWFAISGVNGTFRIAGVPPGEYRLNVFHERALPDTLEKLARTVAIGPEDLALPDLYISEAGYVAPLHNNKFGKNYPAVIVDQYPGARR
jgi:plastocyanin